MGFALPKPPCSVPRHGHPSYRSPVESRKPTGRPAEQGLLFERFLPATVIRRTCKRHGYDFRDRIFSPVVTLWMFLGQTLSPDHSCRDAMHRLNAWRIANGKTKADSNTNAYCKARLRLPEEVLQELTTQSGERCAAVAKDRWRWKGRTVKVADGITLTMPDTPHNQAEYPQAKTQKPGCGTPIMRCVLMFCLHTGAALGISMGQYAGKLTGETSLVQALLSLVLPGEVLLADRYYATFGIIAKAYEDGYDTLMRVHHRRKVDFRRGIKQGPGDQVVAYKKPKKRPGWLSLAQYKQWPEHILVRHVRFIVDVDGFRSKKITLATTLLDAKVYSREDLADLYGLRWQVELDIRSLKTHMQMEHLRCKTPSMVRKEVYAHLIAYNLIRDLIVTTAIQVGSSPKQLSHKGAVQALNAFSERLELGSERLDQLESALHESIAEHPVGDRKPRFHPREIKRRPKPYKQMTRPRHARRRSAA